ncbi:hypothetical protein M2105_003197 [Paenibacillus sp. PastF-1]|nr:hypothetical protein [Paenibacillus sp. PastF-2]MDF9848770.1 hypothetical protein [Paenibacillus sp. PastM-2]MDF9855340.1 hypothetical protein [Paenibacillus sp. PastF-1]MDH6480610.1 hypothetical protein [Paenibacillus sp. PastH-2]
MEFTTDLHSHAPNAGSLASRQWFADNMERSAELR